jgi:hypothetical protein
MYNYKIGSEMTPLLYTISHNSGTASVSVNGDTTDIESNYGVIISQKTYGSNTIISLHSSYYEVNLIDKSLVIELTFAFNN